MHLKYFGKNVFSMSELKTFFYKKKDFGCKVFFLKSSGFKWLDIFRGNQLDHPRRWFFQ